MVQKPTLETRQQYFWLAPLAILILIVGVGGSYLVSALPGVLWKFLIFVAGIFFLLYGSYGALMLPRRRPGQPWYACFKLASSSKPNDYSHGMRYVQLSCGHWTLEPVGECIWPGQPAWCAHKWVGPTSPVTVVAITPRPTVIPKIVFDAELDYR